MDGVRGDDVKIAVCEYLSWENDDRDAEGGGGVRKEGGEERVTVDGRVTERDRGREGGGERKLEG